ncbi:MAG: DUF4845 domain-containing protein [Xanthomonadales bacterium]|nr:DUF4845 domain-containing protein [Gammaproteobacteria bacterium]NNE05382.1 DUF4845 domain-containing protein [Xanthomonadales bacterium]NNL94871.1 DUF4845 domain-containing protein [Xanthomonadales bacterium]
MKIRKQKGLSIVGFLIVLSLIVFTVFIGIRITPIYLEYYSVVSAMNGIASERGSAQYTPFDLRRKMLDRLYLSYTSGQIKEEHIKILRRGGVQLRVTYEVRKPLIGNLDVVASFDRMVRLAN